MGACTTAADADLRRRIVGGGSSAARAAPHLLAAQRRLRLPLLLLQSGDDRVTGPAAAELVFAAAGSPDKTWHLYPESRHELFDDLDRPAVLADLGAWLEIHGA